MQKNNSTRGFSLLEAVVSIAVFAIFAVGIYSGIQFTFETVQLSRLRIVETGLLNEQVELLRNLPYDDVGIINGSPAGVLAKTVTSTYNGVSFVMTRTIRNIDDPFDGTIGGSPNDTSPADYKAAEVSIICLSCKQKQPLTLGTILAPKYLEGDPTHGALFIEVFDANAQAVQGAEVHVVATSTDPTIDLIDTTDNDGMLRLVDLPPGVSAYMITVTKDGFTTDATIMPSQANPNPVKPPPSVVAQSVTEISFSIGEVASIAFATKNNLCEAMPSIALDVIGTNLIGTEPDVLQTEEDVTTDAEGNATIENMVWDSYTIDAPGYNIIGSIPVLPLVLSPGVTLPTTLLLGANTASSLLVTVVDANAQPIAEAEVLLAAPGYSSEKTTGVGHIRQTDWTGESGGDGFVDTTTSPGDLKLLFVGEEYASSGYFESDIFDLGIEATYVSLFAEPFSQPEETGTDSVRLQLASASTTNPGSWDFIGPDETASSYYTPANQTVPGVHDGHRYMRYRVYLSTETATTTPTVSDVYLTYTNSCTPPGQAYFGPLTNQTYTVTITKPGYASYEGEIDITGDTLYQAQLSGTP